MSGWSAIVGATSDERRASVLRVARSLRERGAAIDGFVQREVRDHDGQRAGWNVERLFTRDTLALARPSDHPTLCSYRFAPSAFSAAAGWLRGPGLDVVVFGCVGRLEAARQGHWPAIEEALNAPRGPHALLSIRSSCLANIVLALPDPVASLELPSDPAAEAQLIDVVSGVVGLPQAAAG